MHNKRYNARGYASITRKHDIRPFHWAALQDTEEMQNLLRELSTVDNQNTHTHKAQRHKWRLHIAIKHLDASFAQLGHPCWRREVSHCQNSFLLTIISTINEFNRAFWWNARRCHVVHTPSVYNNVLALFTNRQIGVIIKKRMQTHIIFTRSLQEPTVPKFWRCAVGGFNLNP